MSQSYFSKLDPKEKESRLLQLSSSKGELTIWIKGQKEKHKVSAEDYLRDRLELILDSKNDFYPPSTALLCSFELRGMTFFSQAIFLKGSNGQNVLSLSTDLFKSERRSSYRLLTYPIYEVHAEFDLQEAYEGGKVIDLKSRTSQTALFKNFLKLVEGRDSSQNPKTIKYRVQDLSTTGMAIHVGELEASLFSKGFTYKRVRIEFTDETIIVPELKVVYIVDYLAQDRNLKKFKVGLHFLDLPVSVDEKLGKKINTLLREIDFNKDFENFLK